MPWVILLLAAVCEAVWATALGQSNGFREPVPTVIFFVALVPSMLGLARAAKDLPLGTAYAVWTGVGAALTVSWAIITGNEPVSAAKLIFLAGILAAVVGLKLFPGGKTAARPPSGRNGGE